MSDPRAGSGGGPRSPHPRALRRRAAAAPLAALCAAALCLLAAPPARADDAPSADDSVEAMQRKIDELNNDPMGKALEQMNREGVAADGSAIDPEALKRLLEKRGAATDDESEEGGETGAPPKGKAKARKAKPAEGGFGSPVYWFFMIFISIVGMGFFASGKRNGDIPFVLSGLVLMVFPYFAADTLTLAGVGIALTVAPFLLRGR